MKIGFWFNLSLLLLLFSPSVVSAQNPKDPTTYPDTIIVNSVKLEVTIVGAAVQKSPPQPSGDSPIAPPQRTVATTPDKTITHYVVAGTIGEITYTLLGGPGVSVGTFKAKITNGLYAYILVTGADGSAHNVGFKILGQERIPPASPVAAKSADTKADSHLPPQ